VEKRPIPRRGQIGSFHRGGRREKIPISKDKKSAFSALSAPKRPFSTIDPKPPLPLRERAGVRGNKKKIIQFQYLTTPTLPSPVEGEGKDEDSGDSFHGYGASLRHEKRRLTFFPSLL
jgi:hypothetical protein